MFYNNSHILLCYELNVSSIGRLHSSTTSTSDRQVLVVRMVSADVGMQCVQGSNLADDKKVLRIFTAFLLWNLTETMKFSF